MPQIYRTKGKTRGRGGNDHMNMKNNHKSGLDPICLYPYIKIIQYLGISYILVQGPFDKFYDGRMMIF